MNYLSYLFFHFRWLFFKCLKAWHLNPFFSWLPPFYPRPHWHISLSLLTLLLSHPIPSDHFYLNLFTSIRFRTSSQHPVIFLINFITFHPPTSSLIGSLNQLIPDLQKWRARCRFYTTFSRAEAAEGLICLLLPLGHGKANQFGEVVSC